MSRKNANDAPTLIGKKQLLAWATEICQGQIDVAKYDDLRDGLIPLIIFRPLFPHGYSAELAAHMRAQLTMNPLQRNSRQNWSVLQQLLRSGGVPPSVFDRRGVSSAHPKACYNFLVMAFFLHKLKSGPKDFSVDFALPIEVELSHFLQSPKSLEVVQRSNSVRPVSVGAAVSSASAAQTDYDSAAESGGGGGGFSAGPSADTTPIGTPRLGSIVPQAHYQQQQQQQQHQLTKARNISPTSAATSMTTMQPLFADFHNLQQQQQQQQQDSSMTNIFVSPNSVTRRNNSPPRNNTTSPGRNNSSSGSAGNNAFFSGGIKRIANIKDSGWRYGVDTSTLGEMVIERLRADNSRLQDALAVTEEHGRATQLYCEEQLKFVREHFDMEIKKVQTAARLHQMQLEAQAALSTAMVGAATEAKWRDFERKIELEKKEMAWMTFADDLIPDQLLSSGPASSSFSNVNRTATHSNNDRSNHREQWLQAQLDAARKVVGTERQHRLAVENENGMLREQTSKFVPLLSKLQAEFMDLGDKVQNLCDPSAAAINAELSLKKVRDAAEAQYQSRVDSLRTQLESAANGIHNSISSNEVEWSSAAASSAAQTAEIIKRLQISLYNAQEEFARAKEQAARAEKSAALLREMLHSNCTTAMQRLDLSAMAVDSYSEEVARNVTVLSNQLGSITASVTESVGASHINAICDIVSKATSDNNSNSNVVVERVRDHALKLGTMHQILESRVVAMGRSLKNLAANFVALESEATSRVLTLQQQLSEQQQRHHAEMQQLVATKISETASMQSELALLRQQLSRVSDEHQDFCRRQHAAHQAMERDLMLQVSHLRQAVGEVRRAEALHLQRDQLYSALSDNLSLLASPGATAEQKFRAETKANQLREELRKNSSELKNNSRGGSAEMNNNDVGEAVKEAIAQSHAQLESTLIQLDAQQQSLRALEHAQKLVLAELDVERSRASAFKDEKLLLAEELSQARGEIQNLHKKLQHGESAVNHAKEAMHALVTDAIDYAESMANVLIDQASRFGGLNNSSNNVAATGKSKPRFADPSASAPSSSLSELTTKMKTGGTSLSGTGSSSGSAQRRNSMFGAEAGSSGVAPATLRNAATASAAAATFSSAPPTLFAPKFAPIEMSPPTPKRSAPTTNPSSLPLNIDPAVNKAADGALDDFAAKQKEILAKYGLK